MKTTMHVAGTEDTTWVWSFTVEPLLKMKVRLKGIDYRVSDITLDDKDPDVSHREGRRIVELTQIADSFPTPEEMAKEDTPDDSD